MWIGSGAVNIIAADLIKQFSRVDKVKMRVGALPMYTAQQYGLLFDMVNWWFNNEYINDVDVVVNQTNHWMDWNI